MFRKLFKKKTQTSIFPNGYNNNEKLAAELTRSAIVQCIIDNLLTQNIDVETFDVVANILTKVVDLEINDYEKTRIYVDIVSQINNTTLKSMLK